MHWAYVLNVEDVFRDEQAAFEERRDEIVRRIRNSDFWEDANQGLLAGFYDLEIIAEGLEAAENYYDFYRVWDEFYTLADYQRVWVKTTKNTLEMYTLTTKRGAIDMKDAPITVTADDIWDLHNAELNDRALLVNNCGSVEVWTLAASEEHSNVTVITTADDVWAFCGGEMTDDLAAQLASILTAEVSRRD